MACRITELVLECRDPDKLAEFWCPVLGYEVIGHEPDGLELGLPGVPFGQGPPTLILARTGEGRRRAMANGVRFGRKPKLTRHQIAEALTRREAGESLTDIGRSYNVSHSTISRLNGGDR